MKAFPRMVAKNVTKKISSELMLRSEAAISDPVKDVSKVHFQNLLYFHNHGKRGEG